MQKKNEPVILDHTYPGYKQTWTLSGKNRFNGAYYYSREIVANIIPNVKTDRSWLTVNNYREARDHCIVFVHNNKHPENYDWLKKYKDLVLVVGVKETAEKLKYLGKVIYLPLSVDVESVKKFYNTEKPYKAAYVGRRAKRLGLRLPDGIDYIEGVPRAEMLSMMSEYQTIYAVGRCAIEAKILGCEVKAYDPRFPDPRIWKILDNKEAAKILQKELDKIDGKNNRTNKNRKKSV